MAEHTFVEKVLMRKARKEHVSPGDIVTITPDKVMSHDNTAFIVKKFKATGVRNVWDKEKIVIIFDHCVPAISPAHRQNHEEARAFVSEQGITHFYDDKAGVCHQVMCEEGHVVPGSLVLGADSHSTLYGALGALGIPINRTEMAGIWATGEIWLKVPESIKVVLSGHLREGVYAKDIVLYLLKILRADGAAYKVIEYHGSGVGGLSVASRMTLTNMGVELGAKASVFPIDSVAREWCGERGIDVSGVVFGDEGASYVKEVKVDLNTLEPQVACPHTVDNVKALSEVGSVKVDQGYLGSCTNGRIEDLKEAARVLKGKKVAEGVTLVVYPASVKIKKEAESLGILSVLEEAGAKIMTASCGPCFGAVGSTLQEGQVCISSSNRNFCGRMGSKESFVYLASPAVVAASCVAGKIVGPEV